MAGDCHAAGVPISAKPAGPVATFDAAAAISQHRHNLLTGPASCLPDLAPGQVSALLLQLAPGASAQQVMFAIGQIPGIKLVTGNAVFTTTRQALGSLFSSMAVFAVLLLLGLQILISLLFSAIVQERYRELGLLRALSPGRPDYARHPDRGGSDHRARWAVWPRVWHLTDADLRPHVRLLF